ncbi:hypothetical protein A8C32_09355 [Flavivirga aquatica]|uniref:Uncharacterized protein n=1 Tax=Flavivirga aquatica TaxID=1849968 RepID=A0A1E5SJQ0_9FLAO|nr:hypothetical protein [Flavivirga aquatica]OEJ99357.1 hypothetical protein A8C32_09355 [Flavivirga aquatica]
MENKVIIVNDKNSLIENTTLNKRYESLSGKFEWNLVIIGNSNGYDFRFEFRKILDEIHSIEEMCNTSYNFNIEYPYQNFLSLGKHRYFVKQLNMVFSEKNEHNIKLNLNASLENNNDWGMTPIEINLKDLIINLKT